jgi:ribosome maturation factor RimP
MLGYEFVGVEYLPAGSRTVLRLYIDSSHGITLEDCEQVSRQVSAVLDVEDPIPGHFTLEVSSPGIDRPLFTPEHFRRFAGETVRIRVGTPLAGRRNFTGRLLGASDEEVILVEEGGEERRIPFGEVKRANLAPRR